MFPVVKELQNAGYPIKSVNINDAPTKAQEYRIGSIPTFIYFKDGKEQYRSQGRMRRSMLEDFCRGIRG